MLEASLTVLATGSSGNASLLRIGEQAVLVDAGLHPRELEARLREEGLGLEGLDALLLSHEHHDHARAAPELRRRLPRLPILATHGTAHALARTHGRPVVDRHPGPGGRFRLGPLWGLAFPVPHDAAEPCGFRLERGDFAFGQATDLGAATEAVRAGLTRCRALVLEANHDPWLLQRGRYPDFLKKRVASRRGHLSNEQAARLLEALAWPGLEAVVLAHPSATNNSPERALAAVRPRLPAHVALHVPARGERGPGLTFRMDPSAAFQEGGAPPRQLGLFDASDS